MSKVIPGCKVTFKHPDHGSVIQVTVCRIHPNGNILCKTRNAMWAIPMTSILSVKDGNNEKA